MEREVFVKLISSYQGISSMVRQYAPGEITEQVCRIFGVEIQELEQLLVAGSEGAVKETYGHAFSDLVKHIFQYDWVFEHLKDDISQRVFTALIQYQIIPSPSFLERAVCPEDAQEFRGDSGGRRLF